MSVTTNCFKELLFWGEGAAQSYSGERCAILMPTWWPGRWKSKTSPQSLPTWWLGRWKSKTSPHSLPTWWLGGWESKTTSPHSLPTWWLGGWKIKTSPHSLHFIFSLRGGAVVAELQSMIGNYSKKRQNLYGQH